MPSFLRRAAVLGAALLAAAVLVAALARPAAAAPGDADGLNLDAHAGPAVWIEEYYEVRPGRLDDFVAAYDKEVYALARRTPGYRGYQITTNIDAPRDEHTSQQAADTERIRLGTNDIDDKMIGPHPAIRLEGKTLTERQVNWDFLFRHAYNVKVTHLLRSWDDADKFRARMAELYAKDNGGASWADHLAGTLYKMSNNSWSATYRLIKIGWPVPPPPPGARAATDADGLNLEPRSGPKVALTEHWDVKRGQLKAFLDVYENDVYAAIRAGEGYRGYAIATSLPPEPWETGAAPMPASARASLGGSDRLYTPCPGVMMDAAVRTDTCINVGALYKKTFNVIVVHLVKDWTSRWYYESNDRYAKEHPGHTFHESWKDTIMPKIDNHWDINLRVIQSSLIPYADPAAAGAK